MLEDVSDAEVEPLPRDLFSDDGEEDDMNLADFASVASPDSACGEASSADTESVADDTTDFAHFAERSAIVPLSTQCRTLVDSESHAVLHKCTAAAMLSGHAKQSSDRLSRVRQAKDK